MSVGMRVAGARATTRHRRATNASEHDDAPMRRDRMLAARAASPAARGRCRARKRMRSGEFGKKRVGDVELAPRHAPVAAVRGVERRAVVAVELAVDVQRHLRLARGRLARR